MALDAQLNSEDAAAVLAAAWDVFGMTTGLCERITCDEGSDELQAMIGAQQCSEGRGRLPLPETGKPVTAPPPEAGRPAKRQTGPPPRLPGCQSTPPAPLPDRALRHPHHRVRSPVSSITFPRLRSERPDTAQSARPLGRAPKTRRADLATAIPLHDWLDLFRTALASAHDEATPTLSTVARRMTVSTRTLQRRLDEHGTTWSNEVVAARRAHITRLLHSTELSIDSTAA